MPTTPGAGSRPFAFAVYVTVAALSGLVAFTATAGIVDSMPVAWAVAIVAAGLAGWRSATHPDLGAHLGRTPRVFRLAFMAGAAVVLVQLGLLATFIIDPNVALWTDNIVHPTQSRHSCVSAYWLAAVKATTVPDLYVEAVYRPVIGPNVVRRPNFGPFLADVYEYPPTFLPLPRLLRLVAPDFWGFRRLWFALNLAGVVLGLVAIARRVDDAMGTHAVWLTPWALAAPSVIGTFQTGNVQLLFLVMSAVAMLLFERRRPALGGLILGYAIASKLYPGVLVLYLLLRRDWRGIGWTAAAGAALGLVTIADLGWTPIAVFLAHLPQILSGEAFPGLYRAAPIGINESVPGIVFKLGLFGVPGMGFPAARVVGWIYTAVVVAAVTWLARRPSDRRLDPLVWVAMLILATLRSPFLPFYGAFPGLWLATLIMAVACTRRTLGWWSAALWLVLATHLGQNTPALQVNAILTFGHTLALLALVFAIVPRVDEVREPAQLPDAATPATPVPA